MQRHKHLLKSVLGKAALATALLGGIFFFGGAPSAQAADRDGYYRGARYEDWRRHEAFERRDYIRHERREAYGRGWRDRFGYWHRY